MGFVELLFALTCLVVTAQTTTLRPIPPPMSKTNCESQCGNVTVPFPFGMGEPNCYLNSEFETVCDKSVTPHRLFLNRNKLEVIEMSLYDSSSGRAEQVVVKSQISFYNCGPKGGRKRVDLSGSPFSVSDQNVFVAVSCGAKASLNSVSGNIFSNIGCSSTCSIADNVTVTDTSNTLCNGIDCCQTSITSILDSYSISFRSSNFTGRNGCKYGFLVSRTYWNDYKEHSRNLTEIGDKDYVPLILDWNLVNYSYFDVFKTYESTIYKQTSSNCHNYSNYDSSTDSYGGTNLRCRCSSGWEGNPYLTDGCTQDINECDLSADICSWGSTCVNTYGDYHCSYRKMFIIIGFGSSFGALLLMFGPWGLFNWIKKRKETNRRKKLFIGLLLQHQISSGEGSVKKTKLFNSKELEKATDNFSVDRILGQGGQGTVYKGMLEDGKIVAVKKSKMVDERRLPEFINEVVILSQINHRNIVQLLGCCLETEVPILVYEFIPNGTLSQYIHERNEDFPFSWKMRVRIASEVAGALAYLHSAAAFPIYHRDIKSTNILLDVKYRAKVADFGTSRTIALEQTHLTTMVYGTFGYLDPEYFQSNQFTEKSDVYSFGVVLVELLTGQKAICAMRGDEGRNLASYFIMTMEANGLFNILDVQILENGPKEDISMMANLALTCLSFRGRDRPTMKEVAMELEGMLKPERSEATIERCPANSNSTGSVFDCSAQSSLSQELALLSFKSR